MKLRSAPYLLIFTGMVAAQAALGYYLNARQESIPPVVPLSTLSTSLQGWTLEKELPMEPEVQAVLKADDTLTRIYTSPTDAGRASLFIAFFKSQRAGVAPHSPKNCLPGNGWVPEIATTIAIPVEGRPDPIVVNNYVVQHGDAKNVVIYWYQSHGRVVASEYTAKFHVVADAIRLNRTDTALVRVIVPVSSTGVEAAQKTAVEFTRAAFVSLTEVLPK